MRRLLILLLALLLAVLLFASPALAQEKPVLQTQEGLGYEVFKDGTLIIGGDVVGDCSLVGQSERATVKAPSRETLRQVEVCTEAGFPPPSSASLPHTGGPPFLIVAGALLLGSCAVGSFLGVRP